VSQRSLMDSRDLYDASATSMTVSGSSHTTVKLATPVQRANPSSPPIAHQQHRPSGMGDPGIKVPSGSTSRWSHSTFT